MTTRDKSVIDLTIAIADLPEVKAALEAQAERIADLEHELDESEERYDWLLGRLGGTAP